MTVNIIGIGLDGAAGLTESARQIVERATLLVGSDRHLSYFSHLRTPRVVLGNFRDAIAEIKRHLTQPNNSIVVLVSGDPLYYGLGRLLVNEFPWEQLQFYPHVSSIQLAFNRLKVHWQDAKVISVHGRATDELTKTLQQGAEKIAVLTDNNNSPGAIARLLLALDLPTEYQFWVCENLDGPDERVQLWWPEDVEKQTFSPLNVVVLLRESNRENRENTEGRGFDLGKMPLLGLPDSSFLSYEDRPGLMTKREVRLLVLGELALQPGQVIWDIGAGTGSVSVEIARLCPDSTIYAVEKTAMGSSLIEDNAKRFGVTNIVSVNGSAPDILHRLRVPDRVFVGGSSGKVRNILSACSIKMSAGGIIVLAFATMEHLSAAIGWVEDRKQSDKKWSYRLLQVQLSRSVPVAGLTRFAPLNPVTIMSVNYSL